MLIISKYMQAFSVSQIQPSFRILFEHNVINNYLSKCRTMRNYVNMRTTKQTLNTRKTIENSKCRTTAILGCAAAGLFQMMGEVKCDASIKNPFKTGNEPEVIIRKAVTALIITGIIAAVNWLTWGLLANPILGLLIIFAGVYYEIDRQEKEKSTIRIKL